MTPTTHGLTAMPQLIDAVVQEPAEDASQAEVAFRRMLRGIAAGQIPRNVILKEAKLARDLGVSRSAVREAMSRLEGLQIVEREPNLGIRVFDFVASDIGEILTVREALEGIACQIAATTITNADLDLLTRAVDDAANRAAQGEFTSGFDDDFHFVIARSTGNRRLIQLICDDVQFQLRLAWHGAVTHPVRLQAAIEEHRAILDALGARDPQRSEAAMRRHISNGRNYAVAIQRHEAAMRNDASSFTVDKGKP
jgi:DNA-binding GntR family transcriptional regulator